MDYKVTAIVPAYNEEKKIYAVLYALVACPYVDEVICVDDGSTDKTREIAESVSGVNLIHLEKNRGKAYAISCGILHAKGAITLFIDADINGLSNVCIKKLLIPLTNLGYDAAIGYRTGKFERLFFRPLGGERAYFRKDLLPYLKKFEKKGYGLEVYLNNLYKKKRVKTVEIAVTNTWKHNKQSYSLATWLTFVVILDVLQELVRQQSRYVFLPTRRTTSYVFLFSLLTISTFFALYRSTNPEYVDAMVKNKSISSYEKYKKVVLARVVDPVKDSVYFKEMIELPIRQLEGSASSLILFQ